MGSRGDPVGGLRRARGFSSLQRVRQRRAVMSMGAVHAPAVFVAVLLMPACIGACSSSADQPPHAPQDAQMSAQRASAALQQGRSQTKGSVGAGSADNN